jgi:sterol O-acyltransferase
MASQKLDPELPQLVGTVVAISGADLNGKEPPMHQGSTDSSQDSGAPPAALLSLKRDLGDDWTPEPSSLSSEDDYDDLRSESAIMDDKADPAKKGSFLVEKARAGKLETRHSSGEVPLYRPISNPNTSSSPPPPRMPDRQRRRSVQVILEETAKKGRYILTADDPQIREILQASIEREAEEMNGRKPTKRFRDLVFTKRFTTFDRQNPAGAGSPFHGFFTLFWLAMALLLIRIAAQNWRNYGSVFGGAELLQMMFDREVLAMGLLDGVMTLTTAFSLILQKLIANGYLTWGGSGWIIQNIWQTFYLGASIGFTFYRHWPWTHTIFIVLHAFVYLMKQHSYAFYNGYCRSFLSSVFSRVHPSSYASHSVSSVPPQEPP